MYNRPSFIFLMGVGRSGTSLLQAMLSQHSEIALLPEKKLFWRLLKQGKLGPRTSAKELSEMFNMHLPATCDSSSSCKFYGEKDPKGLHYWNEIVAIERESHLILCLRDPLDVSLSKKKAAWSSHRPTLINDLISRFQVSLTQQVLSKHTNCYLWKFEEACQAPELTTKSLCKALEINFQSSMLKYYEKSDVVRTSLDVTWKSNLRFPVLPKNFGKWKYEASDKKVAFFSGLYMGNQICRHYVKQYVFHIYKRRSFITGFFWVLGILCNMLVLCLFYTREVWRCIWRSQ